MLLNLEKTNEFDSIISKNKHVLVDFYATWCGPCRMLSPVLEELSEDLPELTILKVNVDEHSELAAKFHVTAIPTMIEFKDAKQVDLFRGFLSKEDLHEALEK
jgi:thioredoxin 1